MKTELMLAIILGLLVLIFTGCGKQERNPLVGVWRAPETELRFHEDGTYSLEHGDLENNGIFEVSGSGSIVVFTYEHGNALRNMASRFDLDADRQYLALDRTPAGTLVLSRNRSRQLNSSMQVVGFASKSTHELVWPSAPETNLNRSRVEPTNKGDFQFPSSEGRATHR